MADREPAELTIKKLELAWEMAQSVHPTDKSSYETMFNERLARFRHAYQHIHETLHSDAQEAPS